ncbi:hypothetical protein LOAG_17576 [Loa loa]|uniref:Actin interacting protein 3-like C-terminal domain-containing protein n=1 Tax=Loa loa TaxID=7209 RepID=A0A1S0UI25_LOALO|nr:hypothetical protein LOAG_17576 [Loa loa]EJD75239.1 hypothetical protein LOAG_17576 [Loa loa]
MNANFKRDECVKSGLINNRDGTADWQHIDNKKAPLASGELDEAKDEARKNDNQFLELSSSSQQQQQQQQQQQPERQQQQQQQQLLQQQQRQQQQQQQQPEQQVNDNLKETKSDDDIHLNDNQSITGRSFGVVYLEFNDEVKRALLPPSVRSIDTIRALFLRSFPQLTSQYLSLPYVKIYIQEPSKGQLFYELDDLRDIKDQAVLKLREQLNGYQTTQSNRFVSNHSSFDYLSESEIDLMDYRNRVPTHRYRPASALDSRMLSATGTIKSTRSPISPRYDPYCDPYASDTSSQERSGSVTPVIDKEARFRMESMERQLAGLSSLVHSALISKGMSETSQRDMQELRKQILALHPDGNSTCNSKRSADANVLDTILDELTNTVQRDMRSKSKSPSSAISFLNVRNGPPKPPERHSTTDVRNRFTSCEIQEMQRRAIESVSPSSGNRLPVSIELDGRQEKLIQKQRQLHSQFEQLQQLCAPSNVI